MKMSEVKLLAKELATRYGRDVYIHTDASQGYNLRFGSPIETVSHTATTLGHFNGAGDYTPIDKAEVAPYIRPTPAEWNRITERTLELAHDLSFPIDGCRSGRIQCSKPNFEEVDKPHIVNSDNTDWV